MSAFTQVPRKPYRSMWAALTIGCLVASVAVAVFSNLRGASSGVGFFFFVLYISFAVGAGVTLLVAMPLLWLLIRIGYAGPVSAIAFSCVLFALAGYPDYRYAGVMLVFIVPVLLVFLVAAYTKLFSNNRFERSRVASSVSHGGGR
jgi:peptidoglycan/LPS O-acetylase OafA/YrhL